MRRLEGGFSSAVFRVDLEGADPVVVRFPGVGPDACAREAALAARLTGVVPVAEPLFADPDGAAAGRPCLISRYVDGMPADRVLADGPPDVAGLGTAVGRALAAIGTVSFRRDGLLDARLEPVGERFFEDTPAWLVAFAGERLAEGGRAREHLGAAVADRWLAQLRADAPALAAVNGARELVHSDFNPKNLLVSHDRGRWRVRAVLDWEFAHAGCWLSDLGNLLRFRARLPHSFEHGVTRGLRSAGRALPANWRTIARLLDAAALCDLLERRAPGDSIHDAVAALVRDRVTGLPGD